MTIPRIRTDLPDRIWRVRVWIRVASILVAAVAVAGGLAVALEWQAGVGLPNRWLLAGLAAATGLPPLLAWRPLLRIRSDGTVQVRGVFRELHARADQIRVVAMTPFGLRFVFADSASITSLIFQATMSIGAPRYYEVLQALTGRPVDPYRPWIAPPEFGPRSR